MTNLAVSVAFIGAGGMAVEHAKAFADIDGVRISGFHSRTRSKADALAATYGAAVTCSVQELYETTKADLVVVAVPELEISNVMRDVLQFPWTVLMEKPVGLDLADAKQTVDIASAAGRQVFVGLNRRFLSSTRAALDDLAVAGEPRFVHVYDQQSLDVARQIGHPDMVVRNWMFANSIHIVDYLCAFGRGQVQSVEQVMRWDEANPRIVMAKATFESGDIGIYEGVWNGPGPWSCVVSTTSKRWEMRPLESAVFQTASDRTHHPVEKHSWDTKFKPGFRLQAEQVVSALRGQSHTLPDIHEGLRTMQLVHDIFK